MEINKRKKLAEVDIEEISLVLDPANKKKWAVKKSAEGEKTMSEMIELLKTIFMTEDEKDVAVFKEKTEAIPYPITELLIQSLRSLGDKEYMSVYTPDLLEGIRGLVKIALSAYGVIEKKAGPDNQDDKDNYPSLDSLVPGYQQPANKSDILKHSETLEQRLNRIDGELKEIRNGKNIKKKQEIDPFPSLDAVVPAVKIVKTSTNSKEDLLNELDGIEDTTDPDDMETLEKIKSIRKVPAVKKSIDGDNSDYSEDLEESDMPVFSQFLSSNKASQAE